MTMTLITVSGTFVVANPDGTTSPASGTVTAAATATMEDTAARVIHERTAVVATLGVGGLVSLVLPATDDPTTIPTGVQYVFSIAITGQPLRTFTMALPRATTSVDLSSISTNS